MSSQTPEGKVKAAGREVCKTLGLPYFPQNASTRTRAGVPDDFVLIGGRLVTIEYKATTKQKPTAAQVRVMEWLRKHGAITLVVNADNLASLYDDLRGIIDDQKDPRPYPRTPITRFTGTHPVKL